MLIQTATKLLTKLRVPLAHDLCVEHKLFGSEDGQYTGFMLFLAGTELPNMLKQATLSQENAPAVTIPKNHHQEKAQLGAALPDAPAAAAQDAGICRCGQN
ncbi:hypothetical protein S40293_11446 [Stachybotrys chartarum IBT 40293]|nr:hypothetical protein S40293_11446 [Stachybotrys chartarum IBT 40293]